MDFIFFNNGLGSSESQTKGGDFNKPGVDVLSI